MEKSLLWSVVQMDQVKQLLQKNSFMTKKLHTSVLMILHMS